MIYLDNAATSFPKPNTVIDSMVKCMKEYCANPGRGGHSMSLESSKAVYDARETIANFFKIKNAMRIIFTKNATEALNIAIKGFLKAGDHVITTSMEHNSVIRPLMALKRDLEIEITIIDGYEYGEIDPNIIKNAIQKNTKLMISTLSSNVNGIIMPIKEMASVAHSRDILFLLDASQGSGTLPIDVTDLGIDMMAFPGHKGLLGPQGTGGLYIGDGINLKSFIEGGTGSSSENLFQPDLLPDMQESGTLNTPGIVGLMEGIKYINLKGIENIRNEKHRLLECFLDGIKELNKFVELNKIMVYSSSDIEKNSGIVALNFLDIDSTEVSYVLDKIYNIEVRAGMHCAPLAHNTLGTKASGVVRFSMGCFNTIKEIDTALEALREIAKY
jgi:cysteine desulfurase family protein